MVLTRKTLTIFIQRNLNKLIYTFSAILESIGKLKNLIFLFSISKKLILSPEYYNNSSSFASISGNTSVLRS
jgi:hypothetical protein